MSGPTRSPLHGVGVTRHERRLRQEEAARRWFKLNPRENCRLCCAATGVPHAVAMRVRKQLGLERPDMSRAPVGTP